MRRSCVPLVWAVLSACVFESARGGGVPQSVAVEVVAGSSVINVAAAIERAGLGDAEVVLAAAVNPQLLESVGLGSLEGYLAPGSYNVAGQTIEGLLRAMVGEQKKRLAGLGPHDGLNEERLVIVASLVEAGDDAARLRERLRRGWHLESAAALRHVLDGEGDMSLADLKHDSLYNTFRHTGLPPAPIGNPSLETLQAVLAAEPPESLFELAAVSEELRRALLSVRADPPPEETTRGVHYLVSNEWAQQHFAPAIYRLGGVLVGVGADQNFLFAGWARPDLVVLVDFDQWIVDLHSVHRVAFEHAETPTAYVAFFSRPKRRAHRKLIAEFYKDDPKRRAAALEIFYKGRARVVKRLNELRALHLKDGIESFVTDAEQYAFVRQLWLEGRVVAVRGDLTAKTTMRQLGKVLRDHNQVVRVLYMSNAEQYFRYTKQFRQNMMGLPCDEHSMVLRTRPVGDDYTYVTQPLNNFRLWLEQDHVRTIRDLAPRQKLSSKRPLYEVPEEPPPPKTKKKQG